MVQHSVWRFQDYRVLLAVAERVLAEGGKVLAFVESDRIPMGLKEVRQFLHGVSNRTVGLSIYRNGRCPTHTQ